MAAIDDVIERLFGQNISEDDVLDAFRLDHPDYTAYPRCEPEGDGVCIHGTFHCATPDCRNVGHFERYLGHDGRCLWAEHRKLFVAQDCRRQKIATSHLAKIYAFYDRVGIEYATLKAIDSGPIVFPQLGFELRDADDKALLNSILRSIAKDAGYDVAGDLSRTAALVTAMLPEDPVDGITIGFRAMHELWERLGRRPIPMITDLRDSTTRAFLREKGILES